MSEAGLPPRTPIADAATKRPRGLRAVPLRLLIPNLITLFALGLGLTAIRLANEGSIEWAVSAIAGAAVLDGLDGRIARALKGTSRFGAELDSLADFVDFGVAPALVLYVADLHAASRCDAEPQAFGVADGALDFAVTLPPLSVAAVTLQFPARDVG